MIEFLCPNGHKIHCPETQAGRAAKCPRCGVKFQIPSPAEAEGHDEALDSGVSRAELIDSGKTPPPSREPQIEFLCPNGHRLHGPASLQGRPGECPECGSRFRIPTYDGISEEEETEQEIGVGRADGEASGVDLAEGEASGEGAESAASTGDLEAMPTSVTSTRPRLAEDFVRLWREKADGATIELQLSGGEILKPDHFAPAPSRHSHAFFTQKEPDGTYTLTVVPWDAVVRVVVRGLRKRPAGMEG